MNQTKTACVEMLLKVGDVDASFATCLSEDCEALVLRANLWCRRLALVVVELVAGTVAVAAGGLRLQFQVPGTPMGSPSR